MTNWPPAGGLPFRRPIISEAHANSIAVLDITNWRRDVWLPAREAAGLVGVDSLRRSCSTVGAASRKRHCCCGTPDRKSTERHCARAMQERAHDRARREVQVDKGTSTGERLDALWLAWVKAFPDVIPKLGMDSDNVIDLDTRRRSI